MDYLISFLISIVASIVAYYICKWLDRDELSTVKPKRNPPELQLRGISPFCAQMDFYAFFSQ